MKEVFSEREAKGIDHISLAELPGWSFLICLLFPPMSLSSFLLLFSVAPSSVLFLAPSFLLSFAPSFSLSFCLSPFPFDLYIKQKDIHHIPIPLCPTQ